MHQNINTCHKYMENTNQNSPGTVTQHDDISATSKTDTGRHYPCMLYSSEYKVKYIYANISHRTNTYLMKI